MNNNTISIDDNQIGHNYEPYCIVEVGLNHNGNMDIAKKMIDEAVNAGADAVKFQTFQAKEFCGDPKQLFTYKSQGKHAAGVVISSDNLSEVCPMVRDKHGEEKVAGLEMQDLESMGHVKFDVLGINFLDKIMKIMEDVNCE